MTQEKKETKVFPAKVGEGKIIVKPLPTPEEDPVKSKIITTLGNVDKGEINLADVKPTIERYVTHPWKGMVMTTGSNVDWIKPGDVVAVKAMAVMSQEWVKIDGEMFKVYRDTEILCVL